MTHAAFPLVIELPDGVRAAYVPNTVPPQYTVDGAPCAIEVAIPADLAVAGWYWLGSCLCWPESDPLRPMGIATCTYPPPNWPCEREDCFTVARGSERRRAEWAAQGVAERVAKVTKTKAPKPPKQASADSAPASQVRALTQTQMELF